MTPRVDISPELLTWACERAGVDVEALEHRLPKLPAWIAGEARPTLKQLETFAKATNTPVGYLFLSEPPVERIPIPDMRTMAGRTIARPSPDLLETIYLCQERQEWYRDFARSEGEAPRSFVGSRSIDDNIVRTAEEMREALAFDLEARSRLPTWSDALREFVRHAEALGVLVMTTGIVGNNTRRRLDPAEFRGFALVDSLAPLVFINGADTKAAQMFTLAHELAHVWLGESALSDVTTASTPARRVEAWCNQVAAEILAPISLVKKEHAPNDDLRSNLQRLARRFKVSTLVILRRLWDIGVLGREEHWSLYQHELDRVRDKATPRGGDFYRSQTARVGERFARAIVSSTLEGQTLYSDAFRLLGVKKLKSFQELGARLGVA